MTYIRHLLKAYPVSCFYILMIWILCFATIPSTPLDNVTLIDKWVHIAMYGGTCATIWLEYLRLHTTKPQPVMRIASPADKPLLSWTKLFCLAWIAPILMSGVIEILQEYCTGGRRSGDWLDFAANSIGATVGAVAGVGMVILKRRHIIRLFVFAYFSSFYSYKLMLQEQTPIEWL